MDMETPKNRPLTPRIMFAMLVMTSAAFGQDELDEEPIEPAVEPSATLDEERDALQPRVSGAALAADVTREQFRGQVMDRLTLGRAEITGNQELPKVLYIVPWQKSDPGDLMGRPVNTLLDEILAPLDREEFIRRVSYYGDLYGEEVE